MTLKSHAKFEETCGLENDMRNLPNFQQSTQKSQNWDFNGILLSKVYNVWAKKVQRNYLSWHWTVMQNLKKKLTCGLENVVTKTDSGHKPPQITTNEHKRSQTTSKRPQTTSKPPQITSKQPQTTSKRPETASKWPQSTSKRLQTTDKRPKTATPSHQNKKLSFSFFFSHPTITRTSILKNICNQWGETVSYFHSTCVEQTK